jgi:TIR domain/Pentapeptide repeats (8 copies)
MSQDRNATGHVFISYVREDAERVDRLQHLLEAEGLTVWRDTSDLWPGQDWRIEIRKAIEGGLAFIACFSEHSESRDTSYQNEELIFAIEMIRRRSPGKVWLLPVRFADCQLPPFDLGASRTLDSLQRVDLFNGTAWEPATARLAAAVRKVQAGPSGYEPGRVTVNKADIGRLDDFDKLIADIGKPTPEFGSVQRLLEMGPELYEGCVRIITSICPGEGDTLGDMRPNERRLAARIRSIMTERMPESGNALSRHIELLVHSGKFAEASRLIRFMDRDLLVPALVPTYQDLVESGQFPRSAGQLVEDAIKKYSVDPRSWRLDELKIDGGAWLEVILENVNLTGATINDARFYHCRFSSCDVTKSTFFGCTLHDCAFDGSDLSGASIAGKSSRDRSYMTGVGLKNCILRGATFRLIFTFFDVGRRGSRPHLPKKEERIHFDKSDLSGASFLDCDLRGADFSECRGIEKIKDCSNTRLYGAAGLSQSALEMLIQSN